MLSSPRVGYRRMEGQPVHRRECVCRHGNPVLLDVVTGNSTQVLEAFLHFHPAITVQVISPQAYRLTLAARLIGCISYQHWKEASLSQGWYGPEYGTRAPKTILRLAAMVPLPFTGCIMINLDTALPSGAE